MGKYLLKVSYSKEGLAGLRKEGAANRVKAVTGMLTNAGGQVESFYFGFGDADAYLIVDFPSNAVAAGVATAVSAAGLAHLSTTVLLTPEEVDQGFGTQVDYRPPGA